MAFQGSNAYIEEMLHDTNDEDEKKGNSEIVQFFSGRNVFITGASGFLGQLLTEKLLRSCPNISKVFMLMRAKKGKSVQERFEKYFDHVLFDRLKKEQPDFLSKVQVIEGDVALENLGLSPEDRAILRTTHIVFHGAATVRFDETFHCATNINVKGTLEMLKLAKEMPNIKVFVYVSTAFSHCVRKDIKEQHYNPPIETDKLLALLNIMTDDDVKKVKETLIGKWPNTYTYTKAVAEHAVLQNSTGIPTCIVRPSIIIPTYREPVSGWINNVYGATGVVAGAALGLMRVSYCMSKNVAEIIPADIVIAHMIAAAWYTAVSNPQRGVEQLETKLSDIERVPIFNHVSSCQRPISWGRFMKLNEVNGMEIPSVKSIWFYNFHLQDNYVLYKITAFFMHTIPAIIVDIILRLRGQEPAAVKIYEKIEKFSNVTSYFSMQEWDFDNQATRKLWNSLNPADREIFSFNMEDLDWDDYFYYHIRGLRVYLVNDPMDTLEEGRKKNKRLYYANFAVTTAAVLILFLLLWGLFSLLRCAWSCILN